MSRTLLLALATVGCREIFLPADGGSGTSTVTVGGQGGSGAEGVGGAGGVQPSGGGGSGAGGSGGEAALPVPGCEQLVSAGDPVEILLSTLVAHVRIAALVDERAGLTYTTGLPGQNATIWSLKVHDPFGLWPPMVVEPPQTQLVAELGSYPGQLQGSRDGVFALNDGVPGFFSFDSPGVVRAFEPGWREGFPRPQSSEGALIVSGDTSTNTDVLSSLATFSAAPIPIVEFPDEPCRKTRVLHEADGGAFISRGVAWCEGVPRTDFYRLEGDQLLSLGGFDLPFIPHKQFLTTREGGYFYAISNTNHGMVVYSLDAFGALVQQPWTDTFTIGDSPTMFARWRNGFVISHRVAFDTIHLIVSDGINQTTSSAFGIEQLSSNEEVAMLVGGVDESSIVFAYPQYFDSGVPVRIGLFRADCLTFD